MDAKRIWEATLGELQLQMTQATFDTWLKNTSLVSHEDGTYIIGAPNAYAKDWLQHRLHPLIKETLSRIAGRTVELRFVLQKKNATPPPPRTQAPNGQRAFGHSQYGGAPFNERYTFENFVVGNSNRLAHAAAVAVAENPARAYNPLFIYGGVGLGKTHLLQALGSRFLSSNLQVLYIPAETFTNDLVNAIRTQTTDAFRAKYRHLDAFLVDDVQFIAGKEGTQEELFHTFNSLYEAGRQIVLSCDRPPKAISPLEERLRSRFEWGLIADIQPPDLETRIAILRAKAEHLAISLEDAAIEIIAQKITTNIRELEGALTRLAAYAQMLGTPLNPNIIEHCLSDVLQRPQDLTIAEIVQAVADHFAMDPAQIIGKRRDKQTAYCRQIIMYLAREETKASLIQIGQELGGRDHTTVLHGCQKMGAEIESNDQLRREVFTIREALYNHRAAAPTAQNRPTR